jgi:hypothetical protein
MLDDEDLNLLNNISENETYLEDSPDDIKEHLLAIVEEAAFKDLDAENQAKLYNGIYLNNYGAAK